MDEVQVREPAAGEVRVRVEAIGLNRADVLFRSGQYIEAVAEFPAGLGSEAAGTVDAVGPGDAVSVVPAFSQNDYPLYADLAIAPAAAVVQRPDGVDAITGAAVWMPYLTAYGALVEVGRVRAGDVVAVNAASSSVGLAAIQTINRIGATPVAITRSRAKANDLRDAGATYVVVSDETDVVAELLALTDGKGAEVVLDAVAGSRVRELARAVAADGTLLLWGAQSGEPTPYPGFDLGMPALNLRTYTVHEISRRPDRLRRGVAYVHSGLRSGIFRPRIDRIFGLEEIAAAHKYLESNAQVGKIVVTT